MDIALIVEGHGDVAALPVLVRKIATQLNYFGTLNIPRPFRLGRGKIVKQDEILRAVSFMAHKIGAPGCVFVVFDADDDCPCDLAQQIKGWIRARHNDLCVSVIVANREYESWIMASAEGLRGVRGFALDASCPPDPDIIRDAKGWLNDRMRSPYSETLDQAAFSGQLDVAQALRSRSFRKMHDELAVLLS